MIVNLHYLLFIIVLICSISTMGKMHLNIREHSYSAEDKYKYIMECITKCMENYSQESKPNNFFVIKDQCIQIQCRIYE
jgi:hypothetical protein